jgi:hypothetical protein
MAFVFSASSLPSPFSIAPSLKLRDLFHTSDLFLRSIPLILRLQGRYLPWKPRLPWGGSAAVLCMLRVLCAVHVLCVGTTSLLLLL